MCKLTIYKKDYRIKKIKDNKYCLQKKMFDNISNLWEYIYFNGDDGIRYFGNEETAEMFLRLLIDLDLS